MALLHHNKGIEKLIEKIPRKGAAGYTKLKPLLKEICGMLPMKLHVDGMPAKEIAKGFAIGPVTGPKEIQLMICYPTAFGVPVSLLREGETTTITLETDRQCIFAPIIIEGYGRLPVSFTRNGVTQLPIAGSNYTATTGPAAYVATVGDKSIGFTLAWT